MGIGLVAAASVSEKCGWLTGEDVAVHESLVESIGAPTRIPPGLDVAEILDVIRHDNKRGYLPAGDDEIPLVLLSRLGMPVRVGGKPLALVHVEVIESVVGELIEASR